MILKEESKLREVCEKTSLSEGLKIGSVLISELEKNKNGIGLAAPQIGINKRVFVIKKDLKESPRIFINPVILKKENPFLNINEGCLSFPKSFVNTIRYRNIQAIDDLNQEPYELSGLDAICFEHENDHLDGIIMFDKREPKKYDLCFCDSKKKYKFCHYGKLNGEKRKV